MKGKAKFWFKLVAVVMIVIAMGQILFSIPWEAVALAIGGVTIWILADA